MNYRNFNSEYLNLTGVEPLTNSEKGSISSFQLLHDLSESEDSLFTTEQTGNKIAELTLNVSRGVKFSLWYKYLGATGALGVSLMTDSAINKNTLNSLVPMIQGLLGISWNLPLYFSGLDRSQADTNFVENWNNQNFWINNQVKKVSYVNFSTVRDIPSSRSTTARWATGTNYTIKDLKEALASAEITFNPNSSRVPSSFLGTQNQEADTTTQDSEPEVDTTTTQDSEPEVDTTPTEDIISTARGDEGKSGSSSFDIVSGKFGEYLDLVDKVANKLVEVKGQLDEAKALCKDGQGDEQACDSVEELETYVEGLESQVKTLTEEKVALETFKESVVEALDSDSITNQSTLDEIAAALEQQISQSTQTISEKSIEITTLEEEKADIEDNLDALEEDVMGTLDDIGLNSEAFSEATQALAAMENVFIENREDLQEMIVQSSQAIKQLEDSEVTSGTQETISNINDLRDEDLSLATEITLYVNDLVSQIETIKENYDENVEDLVERGVISEVEVPSLKNIGAAWAKETEKLVQTEAALREAEQLQLAAEGVRDTALDEQGRLAKENERLTTELSSVETKLEEASSELEQFGTLSGELDDAISELEKTLSDNGITLDDESSSFDGGGLSHLFDGEPTNLQKLLFKGVKARKAYLNMSGKEENDKDYSNFASIEDDSSLMAPIIRIGLIAGLFYAASKFFKK